MGEETDGVVESVSKLQEKVMAISGVNILDESGAYKDTYEILKELADVWDEIGQSDPKGQAALLELLAGKNRSNALAAILTNLDDLEGAYDAALKAEGSAQKELDTYLDSIDGRVSIFTNSLQTMWMNAINTDTIKWFVDAGTSLIKVFDQMNQSIGIIPNLGLIGATIYAAWKGIPALFGLVKTATLAQMAATSGETAAINALTGAKIRENFASSASITTDMKEAAISALLTTANGKETIATELNTVAKIKEALATKGITGANAEAVISALGLAAANTTATGSFKLLTKAALKSTVALLKNPITWVVAGVIAAAGAIAYFYTASDRASKKANEQLKETSDELNDIQEGIKSLEDELKTVSDRIDELNSKEKLTLTEKEELKNLKARNSELERQIALEKQMEEIAKNKKVKDALESFRNNEGLQGSYYAPVTDEEGNTTGEFKYDVTEAEATLTYLDQYEKQLISAEKELDRANAKLLDAQKNGKEKDIKNAQKEVDRAQENVDTLRDDVETTRDEITDIMSERNELYGDLDFLYGDDLTENQKEYNDWIALNRAEMHKMAIAVDTTGKAIANAFTEVAGREFFQDELKLIQENVGITGEQLKEMYDAAPDEENGLKSFIQSLIDAGIIAEASATELQKVVDMSIMMNDGASDAELADKKLARSQKRLEYIKLAKQLHSYTKNVKGLTDAQKDEVKQIRTKMSALATEIDAYNILGAQITEAKQSFEAFSKAQEADTESDFTDDVSTMLQTVIEGYQSAEMGSEAFKSAFTSLIPESVYSDIDTLQGKYEAAAKYISETLSDYFKIEYDDDGAISSIEVTTKNVQNFIEDAKSKGLLNFANGVWEVTETDFEGFAEKMGITEEMLVAIGEQMDKIDADWITGDLTSFFDSFEMGIEAELYNDVKALSELDSQLIDGTITVEEYTKKYQELTNAVEVNTNNAIENIKRYNEGSAEVARLTARLEEEKKNLQDMQNSETATDQDIQNQTNLVNALITQLGEAIKKKGELSTIEITVVQEHVNSQFEELKNKWTNTTFTLPVMVDGKLVENELIKLGEDGKYVVETEFDELSEEDIAILERYAELANVQGEINLVVNNSEEEENKLKELNELVDGLEETLTNLSVEVDTTDATNKITLLKEEIKTLEDKVVTITTVNETVNKTRGGGLLSWLGFAKGTAYADGNWGAGVSTNRALVGELGPELRVRNGKYELIGEDGAEFTDVRPNDIIFNHKQTEEIIKNGHISSRGKAYVEGKAFNGTSGTIYTGGAISSAYGGTVPDWFPRNDTLQNLGHIIEDASKDAKDEFDELIDWFEILTEEIDHQISVMEAQLDNAVGINEKSGLYNGLIALEKSKMTAFASGIDLYTKEANKFLSNIPDKYKAMAQDGSVAITDFVGETNEATVEAINDYREYIGKVHDLELQLEETETNVSNLRVEKLQTISEEYENQISLVENLNDQLQSQIDLLEEQGERVSKHYYEAMIANTQEQIKLYKSQKNAIQAELNSAVASGDVKVGSSDWYEMLGAINDVNSSILESEISIESFNNAIRDLHWQEFDRIVEAVSNLADEAENLRELLGEDSDMVDEFGEWTAEGVTSLGLLAQEMENAEYRAKLFADEIEWLNENWEKEGYSVDEYNEKLQELKNGQYDAIQAYENAKKEIIDLNKVRVDAIKDGLQKEIDKYEELIEKQKESLQAKKDERDWANTVKDHTDEITSIQRQIDALAGDSSASAAAKRKQLEEELAAAEEELNEAYYDREIEMAQEALDREAELYRENQEQKITMWEKYLLNEEQVLTDSFNAVSANSQLIHQTLKSVADTYGLTISDSITKPWKNGQTAIAEYSTKFDSAASGYMTRLGLIKQELINLQKIADITAEALAFDVKPNYDDGSGKYEEPKKDNGNGAAFGGKTVSVGSAVTVASTATNFSRDGGNGTKMQSWVPGGTFTVMQVSGDEVLIGKDGGYTGWVKAKDLVGYNTSSSGGGSKGGSSGSGSTSNKTYTSTGGTYTVTSTKGVSFIQGASTGDKMTGGDGSTWVKNANGTVTVTTKDGKKHNIKAHAKGTTGVKSDELAWIDENGLEEIVMHAQGGKLAYLTKGSAVIPHDISENLMELGKVDPKTWMDKNRPTTVPANIVAQNNNFELKFGTLINIEHADKDSIPEIQAAVQKQLDSYMKGLNSRIKSYSR